MTQSNNRYTSIKRIVLVGDAGVGKSIFVRCLQGNIKTHHGHSIIIGHGDNQYDTTGEIFCHPERVGDVRFYELGGGNVASNEQRAFVGDVAHAVIIMFDLARPETLYRAVAWAQWLDDRHPEIPRVLVANKKDIAGEYSHIDLPVLVSCLRETVTAYLITSSNDKESQQKVLNYCVGKLNQ